MKQLFQFFGMMLGIMFLTTSFSACSSDDDDDKNPSIVGTWYVEQVIDAGTEYEYTSYSEITYKKDGTVSGYWKDTYKDGRVSTETDRGRYEVIKDVLNIWWESEAEENEAEGPWTCTFTINGNKMTTSENEGIVWTRK